MDIVSYGGGVQSFTVLALIAHGKVRKPAKIVMADMSPYEAETLAFTQKIAQPLAASLGLSIDIIQPKKSLRDELLKGYVVTPFWWRDERDNKPSLQKRRSCTYNYKVKIVNNIIKRYMWDTIWLGISLDESERMRPDDEKLTRGRMRTNYYPLVDLEMSRTDCIAYLTDNGLPIPPKSACDICPFSDWGRLLKNIAKDNGTYERIQEVQAAWHRNPKNQHKYLTVYLDELPTPTEAKAMLGTLSEDTPDTSGGCGVCEF